MAQAPAWKHTARTLAAVLLLAAGAVRAATIDYAYDSAGRLIGVYAPSGDAAVYVYDPAGNITAIQRFSASDLNVTQFTPPSGPVGTPVTVYGTGFDPTSANDAVTFNGTVAAVSSATANKLVVNVPVGATTGPIGVTVGTRSAQSSTSFVVTSGTSSPTITSFSPLVGAAGTAVTINGANFNSNPALDNVSFNTAFTTASAATNTTIATVVPPTAASGPIKVRTPSGTATSSTDFLVSFGTIAAADVVGSARAVVDGASASFSIPSNGKAFYVLFDGAQTQNIGVAITAPGCTWVYVQRPDNVQIFNQMICSSQSIDLPNLPLTGTYTVALKSSMSAVDSGVVTVSTDATGALGSEGDIGTFSTTRAGQNGRYTFNGTVEQKAAFYVYGLPSTVQPSRIDVLLPNGQVLTTANSSGSSGYIQTQTLPASGTYTVVVSPTGAGTGSWSIQYGQPDLTIASLSVGAVSVAQSGSYQIPITAVVKNQGTVGAKRITWYDELYLSSDGTLDTSDPRLALASNGPDVAAGGTYTVNLTGSTATTVSAGPYTVFFKADGYDRNGNYDETPTGLTEVNETNNVSSSPVTLPGYPDLVVSNLAVGAITVNQNGSYTFTASFTVTNSGGSTAKATWYDECYLSSDGTLDTGDSYIGIRNQTTDLAPGTFYNATITCQVAAGVAPGAYTVFVKTDGYNGSGKYSAYSVVAEADETNNASGAAITIPTLPDLMVSDLSVGTITVNTDGSYSIPITYTVTNNGGSSAKSSWYDECYLSTDGSLDTTDPSIGVHVQQTSLASGAQYVVSLTCRTMTTTSAGPYTLFVKTDGSDAVGRYAAGSILTESNEANNTAAQSVTLPAKP
jgi:YD repeat-containing protein